MMVPAPHQLSSFSVLATALFMAVPVAAILLPKLLRSVKSRRFALAFLFIFVMLSAARGYAIYYPMPCDPWPERWSAEWFLCLL